MITRVHQCSPVFGDERLEFMQLPCCVPVHSVGLDVPAQDVLEMRIVADGQHVWVASSPTDAALLTQMMGGDPAVRTIAVLDVLAHASLTVEYRLSARLAGKAPRVIAQYVPLPQPAPVDLARTLKEALAVIEWMIEANDYEAAGSTCLAWSAMKPTVDRIRKVVRA